MTTSALAKGLGIHRWMSELEEELMLDHLVTARIQLKLKRMKPRQGRVKFNVQQFQDIGTSELYQVTLHNRFQALQLLQQQVAETPRSLEDTWKGLKSIWKETCKEVVGRRKTNIKPWLSTETIMKVSEGRGKKEVLNRSKTRATKATVQKEYQAANKDVKKIVRRDKKKYIENLAQQAEEAAGKKNFKELYLTSKKLTGKLKQTQVLKYTHRDPSSQPRKTN